MNESQNSRRKFIQTATIMAAGALLTNCQEDTKITEKDIRINFNKKFEWRASTTWPPHFPVLGEGIDLFAQQVHKMSGGRLNIKVYGAGEVVPALELFDAVSQGAMQIGHGASYYWVGKIPAAAFFCAFPFGMNAQQINAWLLGDNGMKLWEELYAPFDLIPFVCGNTGVQMGGWFRKELHTINDLKGLKMRMPGIGGKVLSKVGASAQTIPGGEIYTSLERGVIDATEWIGPYHDYKMGFHKVAKYYYYPGWHETGPTLEMIINKQAFEALPPDLQEIVRTATHRANIWMLSEFEAKNNFYLDKLLREENVQLRQFPHEILQTLKKAGREVIEEMTANDPSAKKVYSQVQAFKAKMKAWNKVSERAIIDYL